MYNSKKDDENFQYISRDAAGQKVSPTAGQHTSTAGQAPGRHFLNIDGNVYSNHQYYNHGSVAHEAPVMADRSHDLTAWGRQTYSHSHINSSPIHTQLDRPSADPINRPHETMPLHNGDEVRQLRDRIAYLESKGNKNSRARLVDALIDSLSPTTREVIPPENFDNSGMDVERHTWGDHGTELHRSDQNGDYYSKPVHHLNSMNGISHIPDHIPVDRKERRIETGVYSKYEINPQFTRDPRTVDAARAEELPREHHWNKHPFPHEPPAGSMPIGQINGKRADGHFPVPPSTGEYESYEDVNTGRIRYYHRGNKSSSGIHRFAAPAYAARSNVSESEGIGNQVRHVETITPTGERWVHQERVHEPDYRAMTENQYHADQMKFREEMTAGKTRQENRRSYQKRVAPSHSLHFSGY